MPKITELTYFLASLYYIPEYIRDIVRKAGLVQELPYIEYSPKSTVYWTNILYHLEEKGKINDLVGAVLNDGHSGNAYLKAVLADNNTNFKSPYYKTTIDRKPPADIDQLEKLTQGASTLLPINFLEKGLQKAKSVVRIVTRKSLGSGFVIQNKYILTNNHVIGDIETAESAKIQFNYQEDSSNEPMPVVTKYLNPRVDAGFFTSVKNDWTLIKLNDFSEEDVNLFCFIKLEKVAIHNNDFVNIIQHPGGEAKKIALYHNMVIGCDDERVQYLTDTQRGSSGSPVFNSNWEVVALHHSGGDIPIRNTNKTALANEGININLVIKELEEHRVTL